MTSMDKILHIYINNYELVSLLTTQFMKNLAIEHLISDLFYWSTNSLLRTSCTKLVNEVVGIGVYPWDIYSLPYKNFNIKKQ